MDINPLATSIISEMWSASPSKQTVLMFFLVTFLAFFDQRMHFTYKYTSKNIQTWQCSNTQMVPLKCSCTGKNGAISRSHQSVEVCCVYLIQVALYTALWQTLVNTEISKLPGSTEVRKFFWTEWQLHKMQCTHKVIVRILHLKLSSIWGITKYTCIFFVQHDCIRSDIVMVLKVYLPGYDI